MLLWSESIKINTDFHGPKGGSVAGKLERIMIRCLGYLYSFGNHSAALPPAVILIELQVVLLAIQSKKVSHAK